MKYFSWDAAKNEWLKAHRNISFEEVIFQLERGGLLGVAESPSQARHPNQKVFIVNIDGYAYLVPFVETQEEVFLKTVIPSRKATRDYLGGGSNG